MKKLLVLLLVIAVAGLVALRVGAGRVTVESHAVALSFTDESGAPLGIQFDPMALGASLDSLENAHVGIRAELLVDNPNPIGFQVRSVNFTLQIGDQAPVEGTMEVGEGQERSISAGGETSLPLRANVPVSDLFDHVGDLLSGGFEYHLRGDIRVGVVAGTAGVPFDITERWRLPLPGIPSLPSLDDVLGR